MRGLVLNVCDSQLPPGSPWRTREVESNQAPIFCLEDGYPVFEVWFCYGAAWFCFSRVPNSSLQAQGVRYFESIGQLRAILGELRAG